MTESLTAIIEEHMQSHYRYRNAVDEPWEYPSEAFEKKAGVTGVSRDYAMPDGKDPKDIYVDIAASESRHELLLNYYALIEKMGGLTTENAKAFAQDFNAQVAAFNSEMKALQENDTLGALEQKTIEGYKLQAQAQAFEGLKELVQAGCTEQDLRELRAAAKEEVTQRFDDTYAALESLNPELSVLTPQIENASQKRFVVLGALSKYNVADIKSFSIDGITWQQAKKDPQWARQWEEIQQRTGGELDGWIPAKSTQMRILSQLRQRESQEMAI